MKNHIMFLALAISFFTIQAQESNNLSKGLNVKEKINNFHLLNDEKEIVVSFLNIEDKKKFRLSNKNNNDAFLNEMGHEDSKTIVNIMIRDFENYDKDSRSNFDSFKKSIFNSKFIKNVNFDIEEIEVNDLIGKIKSIRKNIVINNIKFYSSLKKKSDKNLKELFNLFHDVKSINIIKSGISDFKIVKNLLKPLKYIKQLSIKGDVISDINETQAKEFSTIIKRLHTFSLEEIEVFDSTGIFFHKININSFGKLFIGNKLKKISFNSVGFLSVSDKNLKKIGEKFNKLEYIKILNGCRFINAKDSIEKISKNFPEKLNFYMYDKYTKKIIWAGEYDENFKF